MSDVDDIGYTGPATLTAALEARAGHPGWLVLAGATDVMVPGPRRVEPPGVLDLFGVDELHGVELVGGTVRIGACTTYAELLASALLAGTLPLLRSAAGDVGAVQIRERGTIGGNVVTSSPVGDLLPGLLALDASVVLASVHGIRVLPYDGFVRGYRAIDLGPDELLVAVEIPVPAPGTVQHWRKVGTRAAQAISKVSLAAAALVEHGRVTDTRLAFGGVADHPLRLHAVEVLVDRGAPPDVVEAAVREALHPITDVRSTAGYRRDVAARLAARFVAGLG